MFAYTRGVALIPHPDLFGEMEHAAEDEARAMHLALTLAGAFVNGWEACRRDALAAGRCVDRGNSAVYDWANGIIEHPTYADVRDYLLTQWAPYPLACAVAIKVSRYRSGQWR